MVPKIVARCVEHDLHQRDVSGSIKTSAKVAAVGEGDGLLGRCPTSSEEGTALGIRAFAQPPAIPLMSEVAVGGRRGDD